jgi:hypothetical protein
MFIKVQAVPLLQNIKHCNGVSESHLKIRPNSLAQMFQFTNLREQRENRFDQHSIVPLAALANLQIFRLIDFASKAFVRQDDHFVLNGFDERQEFLIGNIRRFHRPIGNESELVRQNTELSADNPFPGSKPLLADALAVWLMNFANRMTKLNSVRVDHAENGRFSQKLSSQSTMRFQTAKKSRAVGQSRKQSNPILSEPAIKSVLRAAFESKQQSQSNQLADRKFGLNMFQSLWQHLVYTAIKFYDKVFLSHGIGFLCVVFGHLHFRNFSVTFSTSTNGYLVIMWLKQSNLQRCC